MTEQSLEYRVGDLEEWRAEVRVRIQTLEKSDDVDDLREQVTNMRVDIAELKTRLALIMAGVGMAVGVASSLLTKVLG